METSALYSFEPIADFSVRIGGLDKTTTYYVRAYASNPRGLVYGPESSFTTTEESGGISSDGYDDGDEIVKDGWPEDENWGAAEDENFK